METKGKRIRLNETAMSLDNLPPEVLYFLFDYLPPRTLYYVIRLVCKRFAQLLSSDGYFMARFKQKYLSQPSVEYPLLDLYNLNMSYVDSSNIGEYVTWTDLSVRTDIREYLWGGENPIHHRVFSDPHNTTVDAVRLLQDGRVCVSGGRDKLLCMWNIDEIPETEPARPIAVQHEAHDGWIWNVTSHEQESFFTCGWDMEIKHWSVSRFRCIQTLKTERPAMCLSSVPGLLASGLHNGKIVLQDPRIGDRDCDRSRKIHKGSITGIQIWGNHIFTVGEDSRMASFDIRSKRRIFYRDINHIEKSCPRCIGVYNDLVYVGDSRGSLSIFHVNHGDDVPVSSMKLGEGRGINAILPSLEGIIVGTSDIGIRFITPSEPPRIDNEIDCSGEVTSIDIKNNVLVAGCSNSQKCLHVLRGGNLFGDKR